MKPLSKALLFGCAILLVAVSGAFMTSLNLGGLLSPKDEELVPLPVVTPFPTPDAEPADATVRTTETPSMSTGGTLNPYSSNADPVPARGYAPEYVAPGTRFVVGSEPDPAPTELVDDSVTTEATPDLPAAIAPPSNNPAPSSFATTSFTTAATSPTVGTVGSTTTRPAKTTVTTRDPTVSPPTTTAPTTETSNAKTHSTTSLTPEARSAPEQTTVASPSTPTVTTPNVTATTLAEETPTPKTSTPTTPPTTTGPTSATPDATPSITATSTHANGPAGSASPTVTESRTASRTTVEIDRDDGSDDDARVAGMDSADVSRIVLRCAPC